MSYAAIPAVVEAFARGDLVVVVDDADRENEGDLIMAAEMATEEKIGFMVRYTSGVICVPMLGQRLDELRLPLMVMDNAESFRTGFTVSVDLAQGRNHRDLRSRPDEDDQGVGLERNAGGRSESAGTPVPAPVQGGGCLAAPWPHRSVRGSGGDGGDESHGRPVRDRQR